MIRPEPYKLINTIQHYEWGTKGKNAFIPKLLNTKAEKAKPYAELWMGAHPKASSKIIVHGKPRNLSDVIHQYPNEMLGEKIAKKFSKRLPFLFKILSAGEALSIQAHPNKRQAKTLHKKNPDNYPDENQKHEIAIALDTLTALVGFKSIIEMEKTLWNYPELSEFIGKIDWVTVKQKKSMKQIFDLFFKKSARNQTGLEEVIEKLYHRIIKKKNKTEIERHFIQLCKKYKSDVGLLLIFFLNLVHLKSGDAIFTAPGIPHAYLNGNILECMSNSDNVIRAGLTTKHKDIESLERILKFEPGSPKVLKGKKQKNIISFKTNAEEFEVRIINLVKDSLEFKNQFGPRILLILEGEINLTHQDEENSGSKHYQKGDSIFLPDILKNFKIIPLEKTLLAQVSIP